MAYIINDTRGQIVAVVEDGTFDTTSTDVVLIGRGITDYGDQQNTNFVWLMENFANDTAPPLPLQGQLWYNTDNNTLYVRNTSDLWTGLVDLSSNQTFTGQKTFVGGIIAGSAAAPDRASYNFYDGNPAGSTSSIYFRPDLNAIEVSLLNSVKLTIFSDLTEFRDKIRVIQGIVFLDNTVQTSAGGDAFLSREQTFTGQKTFVGGIIAGSAAAPGTAKYNFYDGNPAGSTSSIYFRPDLNAIEVSLLNSVKLTIFSDLTEFRDKIRVIQGIVFPDNTVQTTGWNGTYNYADVFLAGAQTFTGQKTFVGGIIAGSPEYPGTASYNFYDGNSAGSTSSIFFRPDIDAIEIALYNDVKVTFFETYTEFTDRIRVIQGIRFADNTVQTTAASAAYSLPIATTGTLGGVKPDGTSIVINSTTGVISANLTAFLTNYVTLGTQQNIFGLKTFTGGIITGSPSSLGTASYNFYDQGSSGNASISTSSIFFRNDQQSIEIALFDDIKTTWFQNLIIFWEQIRVDGGIRFSDGSIQTTAAVGGSYSLPIATTTTLGGVKVDGSSIIINASTGVISAAGGGGGGDATLATDQTFTGRKTFVGGIIAGSPSSLGTASFNFYDQGPSGNASISTSSIFYRNDQQTVEIALLDQVKLTIFTDNTTFNTQIRVPASGIRFSDGTTQTSAAVGGAYSLPIATTTILGGVKPDGTSININPLTGVISANLSAALTNYVTLATTQVITGQKQFQGGIIAGSAAAPGTAKYNFYDGNPAGSTSSIAFQPANNTLEIILLNELLTTWFNNLIVFYEQIRVDGGIRFLDGSVQTSAAVGGTYTLPIATSSILGGVKPDGTSIVINASTGVISAAGGTPPAGSNTEIQFNDAGAFGGKNTFTFNKTTNTLTLTGNVIGNNVLVNQAYTGLSNSTNSGIGLINCSLSNYYIKSLNAPTTISFSNIPVAGTAYSFTMQATLGAAGSLTFPASVKWQNARLPYFAPNKTHLVMMVTSDGGTNWYASAITGY